MGFQQTSWTLVRLSTLGDDEASAALDELCGRYWEPLYTFARCSGRSVEDAEDDVQSFLAKAGDGSLFGAARQDRGKLRTFLVASFKRHLVDAFRRESAIKRGGGTVSLSIDDEEQGIQLLSLIHI